MGHTTFWRLHERKSLKLRRFVFGILLTWVLARSVQASLEPPNSWFRGFTLVLGESLFIFCILSMAWNWTEERRGIHSRGIIRKVVFGFLLAWAFKDALSSALEAPNALDTSAWIGVLVFFLSFGQSLIFMVALYLIWNFLMNDFQKRGQIIERSLKVLYILLEFGLGGFIAYEVLAIAIHAAGFIGGLVGLIFLPLTAIVAPIYELVKSGNWWPVLLVYGSGLALWMLQVLPGIVIGLGHSSYTPPPVLAPVPASPVNPVSIPSQVTVPPNDLTSPGSPSLTDCIFSDIPYVSSGAAFALDLIRSLNLSGWRGGAPAFTDSEKAAMQRSLDNFLRTAHDMANEQGKGEILFHPDAVEPLQRLFGGEALKELGDGGWALSGELPKYWTPHASVYLKAWLITFDPLVLLTLSQLLALAGFKTEAKKAAEIVASLFPSYAPHYYGSSGVEAMRKSFATSRIGSDVVGHVAALAKETLQTL